MKVITNRNLGPKYGLKVRKQYIKYYNFAHDVYECNKCNNIKPSVKRLAAGIWFCKKCNHKFVGYAYHPYSDL